jgi:hypothetical protein
MSLAISKDSSKLSLTNFYNKVIKAGAKSAPTLDALKKITDDTIGALENHMKFLVTKDPTNLQISDFKVFADLPGPTQMEIKAVKDDILSRIGSHMNYHGEIKRNPYITIKDGPNHGFCILELTGAGHGALGRFFADQITESIATGNDSKLTLFAKANSSILIIYSDNLKFLHGKGFTAAKFPKTANQSARIAAFKRDYNKLLEAFKNQKNGVQKIDFEVISKEMV